MAEPTSFLLLDEAFQFAQSKNCDLLVHVQASTLLAMAYSEEKNKFLALLKEDKFTLSNLPEIVRNNNLLKASFRDVKVVVNSVVSTIVPSVMYEEAQAKEYLDFNHEPQENSKVMSNEMKLLDAHNVFSIPALTSSLIHHSFKKPRVFHSSNPLVEGLLSLYKNKIDINLFISSDGSSMELVIIRSGKLLLYNQFAYNTPADFIYFMLFACEQLQLNPEQIPVILLGKIDKNSPESNIIEQYFRHVSWMHRPGQLEYSYQFDKIPDYQFAHLFLLEVCGS